MKAGKIGSLILFGALLAFTVLVGIVANELSARGVPPWRSVLLMAGGAAVLLAAIVIPLGFAVDRTITKLEASIDRVGSGEHLDSGTPTGYSLFPTAFRMWLLPITRAFTAMADRFHQREQALQSQVRDMEIRHHVAEAQRRQIDHVLCALQEPVIVTNAYNEIVMCNDAAAEVFGCSVSEAMHQPIGSILRDARLCKLINDARESANFSDTRHVELEIAEPALQALREEEGGEGGALAFVGESNADRNKPAPTVYDVSFTCISNHKHEVGGVVTILRDLTRERELSQMKTDFVSKASHELRTPLSSIRAYVEMLVDGDFQESVIGNGAPSALGPQPTAGHGKHASPTTLHDVYRIIQDETERLARLIDNMLNISRIEAGIVQIEREVVDMKELIDRAIHTLAAQAEEKGLILVSKPSAIDLSVEGDADMLYQVMLNLISNAIKYTPHGSGGRITASADTDNLTRSVVISIQDTGLGIPPDALPKLFDKFFRVENYKRVAQGTGLGLSLCKHIVETVHQGQIGVESKLGMGSRFWFSIPMRYAGSQAA